MPSPKDYCRSPSDEDLHTIQISNSVAVRVYSSTRPHNLKIANLQKGLVLVHDGTETVGEGTGFGVPALVYSHETYFSGTAKMHISKIDGEWLIRKEFLMDRVPRNNFRNIKLQNWKARNLLGHFSRFYREQRRFRFLILKGLTQKMQIGTTFVKARPAGCVTVNYTVDGNNIRVETDFTGVRREKLEKMFVLNEQGSMFFGRYIDSEGDELKESRMGAWDEVLGDWASICSAKNGFGFKLWTKEDGILRRGREYVKDSLDWVGLDYEIGPTKSRFEYAIEILEL
jgi:hypothetical protein